MLANFNVPHLDTYDGLGDPLNHLENFRTLILFHQAFDGILYQAFPSTFKGMARHWYSNLKPSSINFLKELISYSPPTSVVANGINRSWTI